MTFISEEIVYLEKALSVSLLSAMLHSGAAECVLGYSVTLQIETTQFVIITITYEVKFLNTTF